MPRSGHFFCSRAYSGKRREEWPLAFGIKEGMLSGGRRNPDLGEMKLLAARLSRLLLFGMLLVSLYGEVASAQSAFCRGKCKVRCSKASVHDQCLKYCGLCCRVCNCVPSGTYGNKNECPCYRDIYTGVGRRRRPKCP